MNNPHTAWVKRIPGESSPRHQLVCFPHAGGGASFFRPWRAVLPSDVELLVIQYPGREDRLREPFVETMDQLVAGVSAWLSPELSVPSTFFGHSMGALVAYETVRQWQRMGLPLPERLVVSSQFAPGELPVNDLHLRCDEDLLDAVEKLGGVPSDVRRTAELREFTASLIRADYQVLETYEPSDGEPVDVALTAFCGQHDLAVTPDDVVRWSAFTTNTFTQHTFPGSHFYVRSHQVDAVSTVTELMSRISR
ncbi:thioesterase II family protein [Streptomyces silvisoli]|uniref:Thioesterase domain-containing protein n=1 Tax=Streptomyces silvisoli TaxID=3034235 RepID=A0ABT5ZVU6_9ACTN|nr:thioesterase domain-containing protein [Streptomyces silvisoli]MDF3293944.1 thioesterase domain-containing protein [Streptomyces silvisoli]